MFTLHIKTTLKFNCSMDHHNITLDPQNIADMFNTYFVNVGPELANNIDAPQTCFREFLSEPCNNSLFLAPTNCHEVLKIVQSLKSSASTGHDGISVKLLKKIIHFIVNPLIYIFNLSIASGVCPKSLKIAKVIPINLKKMIPL